MPVAHIFTHVAFENAGTLAELLLQRGYALRQHDVCTLDWDHVVPEEPGLWLVMGGPIGVYEQQRYPFLSAEIAALRRRLQAQRPLLGICLGAQLIAAALGARVHPGAAGKELGWAPLTAGEDLQHAPWFAPLVAPDVPVLHWHGDTWERPAGVWHLAATPRYPEQAFARGRHTLALQFHPEVDADHLQSWYVGHACELAAAHIDVVHLRHTSAQHATALRQACAAALGAWLDQLQA